MSHPGPRRSPTRRLCTAPGWTTAAPWATILRSRGRLVARSRRDSSTLQTRLPRDALTVDDAAARGVLIKESMATRFWPGESALGRTIRSDGDRHVVGIVKDTRMYAGNMILAESALYEPIAGRTIPQLLVQHADAAAFEAVRTLAVALEPRAQVHIAPLGDNLNRLLDEPRLYAAFATALGLLTLLLATFGVFSSFAYIVQQRTPEIAVRMALGARPMQVLSLIIWGSARALLAGVAGGLAAAVAASRIIRSLLFGLSPFDPLVRRRRRRADRPRPRRQSVPRAPRPDREPEKRPCGLAIASAVAVSASPTDTRRRLASGVHSSRRAPLDHPTRRGGWRTHSPDGERRRNPSMSTSSAVSQPPWAPKRGHDRRRRLGVRDDDAPAARSPSGCCAGMRTPGSRWRRCRNLIDGRISCG